MSIEQGSPLKPNYSIEVKAILFDYKTSDLSATVADGIKDLDYYNIENFNIKSDPRNMSITTYSLRLKNIVKSYQDMFLNLNVVFYIKIVEKIAMDGVEFTSTVLENFYKVSTFSYNDTGPTLFLNYDLVSFSSAALLFSQRYNSTASTKETLIDVSSGHELITDIMSSAQNHFSSNVNLLLEEYNSNKFISFLPIPKDIVFRNHIHTSGLNRFAYKNARLPIRNDLNDITIINYVLKNYGLYMTPTWFIFDDSRLGFNYWTGATPEQDLATTARIYTYVFINLYNVSGLTKSSCWNTDIKDITSLTESVSISTIGVDALATNYNSKSATTSDADNILETVTGNGIDYVPLKAYASEFKLNSYMNRSESLIDGEKLKTKLRSRIILKSSSDTHKIIEPVNDWKNGVVNTLTIDTDMSADEFLTTLKCEKFLYDNDASIYKAEFNNMRYNVLDYNTAYDLITKLKFNYVLLSFNKSFTFDSESKGYSLKINCEFIYLPDSVLVSLNETNINAEPTFSESISNFKNSVISSLTGNNNEDMLTKLGIDWEIYKNLSDADKKSVLQSIAAGVSDNVKYSKTQFGKSTYYNEDSADRALTANGELFDSKGMTCASNTYPFNTLLLVENKDTGKSVIVRVNDRGGFDKGNYANSGRVIDLTEGAADAVGMVNAGVANVGITVLEWGDGKRVKR